MMDLAVDALFCILYLVETQYVADNDKADYPDPHWLFVSRPHSLWLVAVAMSSWNVMSALIRFVFADSRQVRQLRYRLSHRVFLLLCYQSVPSIYKH